MSRGISRLQRTIVGILDGSLRRKAYSPGPLDTRELVEELRAQGAMSDEKPQRQAMATVVRACRNLIGRGLVSGRRVPRIDLIGRITICWSAVRRDDLPISKSSDDGKDDKR